MGSCSIHITQGAEEDLEGIWVFIARDNPEAATSYLYSLKEKLALLERFPEMGEEASHLFPGCRVHRINKFLVIYSFEPPLIIIWRVLHQSRDVPAQFKDAFDADQFKE